MKKLLFITLLSVSELAFAFTPSQDQALVHGRWDLLSINLEGHSSLFGDRNTHSNSFTWFLVEEYNKSVNGKLVRRNGKAIVEKSILQAITVNCQQRKIRVNSLNTYQGSFIKLEIGRDPKLISSTNNVGVEFLPVPNTFAEAVYNYVCHEKTFFS